MNKPVRMIAWRSRALNIAKYGYSHMLRTGQAEGTFGDWTYKVDYAAQGSMEHAVTVTDGFGNVATFPVRKSWY